MRLKTQFVICLIFFAIVLSIAAVSLASTEQQIVSFSRQQEILRTIENQVSSLNSVSIDYFLYQEDLQLARWEERSAAISREITLLQASTSEQQLLIDRLSNSVKNLTSQFNEVSAYLQSASRNVSVRIDPAFQIRWSNMAVQSQMLASDASQLSHLVAHQVSEANTTNIILLSLLVSAFGAFLATIYLMVFRKTLRSVTHLQDGINTVSTGNLGFRIAEEGNNEITALSIAFNKMSSNLKEITTSKVDLEKEVSERKKAEKEITRRVKVEEGTNKILHQALTASNEQVLGEEILAVAEEITGSKIGFIGEINEKGLQDIAISNPGWVACKMTDQSGHRRPPGNFRFHGVYGRVLINEKGFYTNDPLALPDSIGLPDGHPPLSSFLGVPLISNGELVGMIALGNRDGGYTQNELEMIEALSPAIVEAFARKRSQEALKQRTEQLERTQIKLEEKAAEVEEYATRMEELANERARKLKDAERLVAIGATAGMVGHDIRNPLQIIVSDLYFAKKDLNKLPLDATIISVKEHLSSIELSVSYINKIVQDLQDYAKPLKVSLQELNLRSVCDEVNSKINIPPSVTAECSVDEAAGTLVTDPLILKRILSNLINNAIQAMPNGGKLTVQAKRKGDSAIILVSDTGEGISDDVKDKLFTPLFTTKSKGQGFGLAVVKRMTEALGGTVSFESELGKGTTFKIYLPDKC